MNRHKEGKPSITMDDAGEQNVQGMLGRRVIVKGVKYALSDISAEARQLIAGAAKDDMPL